MSGQSPSIYINHHDQRHHHGRRLGRPSQARGRRTRWLQQERPHPRHVRVNQPAWIRLVYVLTSGHHIPITQGWYIDEDKVNQLVEYPDSFEIVAPFGVEMIHAMASTEKPPRLVTRQTTIEGEPTMERL